MLDEFVECEAAVKRSAEFREALEKRGVATSNLVMVDPWSAGMYGTELPEDKGKRLSRALCWVRSEAERQRLRAAARRRGGRRRSGRRWKCVRVEDYGVVPLPPTSRQLGPRVHHAKRATT